VLARVAEVGLRAASREAGVAPSTVRGWTSSSPAVAESRQALHSAMIGAALDLVRPLGSPVEQVVSRGG